MNRSDFLKHITALTLLSSTGNLYGKGLVSNENTLIVYLSRTRNTKAVAEMIQKEIGGKLVSLELLKPYPKDYKAIVHQVAKENETGYIPALKTELGSLDNYETIFIGFPTWGMQLPPPINSFLNSYDLKGKTILPFNTNAGYGLGNSIETIKNLASKSNVLDAFETKGGIERDGILFVMKGERQTQVQAEIQNWLPQSTK